MVTVTGTGFVPTTVIHVNGTPRTTTFLSSTQVSLTLTAADLSAAASLSLDAVNPAPGGGTSANATVAVLASNPAPAIATVNPATELVGASSPVIAITGTGFTASTVIDVNGSPRPTTFSSAIQLNVTLTAADVLATGSLSLTAVNPPPGGGASAAIHVAINNPPVGTIQLSPSTLTAGATRPAVVTVAGDRFVTASVAQVNGTARSTTWDRFQRRLDGQPGHHSSADNLRERNPAHRQRERLGDCELRMGGDHRIQFLCRAAVSRKSSR